MPHFWVLDNSGIHFVVYLLIHFVLRFYWTSHHSSIARGEFDGVFSIPIVNDAKLERCLRTIHGINELVITTNGTFVVYLGMYIMWIVPIFINASLQLTLGRERNLNIHLSVSVHAIVVFALKLVLTAAMTAQVKALPFQQQIISISMIIMNTRTKPEN